MFLKYIIGMVITAILLAAFFFFWQYLTHFRLADNGIRYDRPLYAGNNALRYYYIGRTYPTGDDIVRMCIEERGSTNYGINYSWKRPEVPATKTYAAYLSAPAFAEKLSRDTAQILAQLRARQERERSRTGRYADGPEKERGDLLPISETVPAALLYRYQYRNDPACVAALIAEDTALVPAGLRRLCTSNEGTIAAGE